MNSNCTYKILKYIAITVLVYFTLKFTCNDKLKDIDTIIIALIISVGLALIENLNSMFSTKTDAANNNGNNNLTCGGKTAPNARTIENMAGKKKNKQANSKKTPKKQINTKKTSKKQINTKKTSKKQINTKKPPKKQINVKKTTKKQINAKKISKKQASKKNKNKKKKTVSVSSDSDDVSISNAVTTSLPTVIAGESKDGKKLVNVQTDNGIEKYHYDSNKQMYIPENGIGITDYGDKSDLNRVPISSLEYEYGYSFMPPKNWYPVPANAPVCISEKKCPVCPVYTNGTYTDLKEWNNSSRIA